MKCFVITHRHVWSGLERLLSSKTWYNTDDGLLMFADLQMLVALSEERVRSVSMGDSMRLNGKLKEFYLMLGSLPDGCV